MRLSTTLLLAATTLFTLTGCGGLSSGEEDTGVPYSEPTGDMTPADESVNPNDYDADGRADGYDDPIVFIQPGTVEESSVPLLCGHQSIKQYTGTSCLGNYGDGLDDGWVNCSIEGRDATFQGEHYECFPVTDNGDTWVGNGRNGELDECGDASDASFGSFSCWWNLTGNARVDVFAVQNTDGTYALAWVVVDNWAFEAPDGRTGATGG